LQHEAKGLERRRGSKEIIALPPNLGYPTRQMPRPARRLIHLAVAVSLTATFFPRAVLCVGSGHLAIEPAGACCCHEDGDPHRDHSWHDSDGCPGDCTDTPFAVPALSRSKGAADAADAPAMMAAIPAPARAALGTSRATSWHRSRAASHVLGPPRALRTTVELR
jgi:hypothetical protein